MAGGRGSAGSFMIPAPKGVYQADGDTNINVNYAARAQNIRTEYGMLASSHGTSVSDMPPLPEPAQTLVRFYRRNRAEEEDYADVFVAGAGGRLYAYTAGSDGWMEYGETFYSSKWSSATYEAVVEGETVDILLLSNEKDGMVAIYGTDDLRLERKMLKLGEGNEEVKFAVLGRHAERIWGAGDRKHPDSIYYSRPYDPFDWTGRDDMPEQGGGMIQLPTWDGDAFIALEPFGGYMLAVKQRTVFEVRGTDPSSFAVTAAYGTSGPVAGRTVCTDRLRTYFLSQSGLGAYDGTSIQLLARDALHETMSLRAADSAHLATACVCDHVYYLALCIDDGDNTVIGNNTVIEFDTERGTFMIRKGIYVRDFYVLGGTIYYTRADSPHDVMIYNDRRSSTYNLQPIKSIWETPWLDLGKSYVKRDFELRFTAQADADSVPLDMEIITERKEKKKTVLLGQRRRDYRVKIQNSGKRVKLRVSSGKKAAGFRIFGGIEVGYTAEED